MLAADRSLLEVNLKQSAIKLREKELNLLNENILSISTTAAVLAGFTTTCLIELRFPEDCNPYIQACLHLSSIISICSNLICVSLATITSIWGSGKALRGRDGSMDEAVEGISKERNLIFNAFAIGLATNLLAIFSVCCVLMKPPFSYIAILVVAYTAYIIASNSLRITKKFQLIESVRLDDLTGGGVTAPVSLLGTRFMRKDETSKV